MIIITFMIDLRKVTTLPEYFKVCEVLWDVEIVKGAIALQVLFVCSVRSNFQATKSAQCAL